MEHTTSSQLILRNSNPHINDFITKIDAKWKQIAKTGMTRKDYGHLRTRLALVWGDKEESDNYLKKLRNNRARSAYRDIQNADSSLFLATVLGIPPTECAQTKFDPTVNYIASLENYGSYRLSLSPAAQEFFESTAAELGFASSRGYLKFIQALFPQVLICKCEIEKSDATVQDDSQIAPTKRGRSEETDLDQVDAQPVDAQPFKRSRLESQQFPGNPTGQEEQYLGFSCMKCEKIETLPELCRAGMKMCKLWKEERRRGGLAITNCLSLYMPTTHDEDAILQVRISYQDGWNLFDSLGFGDPITEGDGSEQHIDSLKSEGDGCEQHIDALQKDE